MKNEAAQTHYYKDDTRSKSSFSEFRKKAKAAKAKAQSDKTYSDTKKYGVKFADAKVIIAEEENLRQNYNLSLIEPKII